jgi:hypothetical protein
MLGEAEAPTGIKNTIWKAMKVTYTNAARFTRMHVLFEHKLIEFRLQPLQFKIGITCHAMLPNTSLRMFTCRSAPVTADEFPDDASDPETAWPRLQEDDPALHALWGESVSVQISERHSDSTGQFEWPSMPRPHVVQSQIKFGEGGVGVCDCV